MKQYDFKSETTHNLKDKVSEDYSVLTWEYISPIISGMWKGYIDNAGVSLEDIIDSYKKNNCDIYGSVTFEYIPCSLEGKWNFGILHKANVSSMKTGKDKYGNPIYTPCDQYIIRSDFFSVDANKVVMDVLKKTFPFLDEDVFYREKELEYNDLSDMKVKDIIDIIGDWSIGSLTKEKLEKDKEILEKIKKTKKVREPLWKAYFSESDTHIFIGEGGCISVLVDLKLLRERNYDGIINKDYDIQKWFIDKLSEEKKERRINNPMMDRIKEYCLTGK